MCVARGCSAAFYQTKSPSRTRPQGVHDATRCHHAIAYDFDGVSGFQQTKSTLLFPTAQIPDRKARVVDRMHSSVRWCCCGRFVAAGCSVTLRKWNVPLENQCAIGKRNAPLENGKCSDRVPSMFRCAPSMLFLRAHTYERSKCETRPIAQCSVPP